MRKIDLGLPIGVPGERKPAYGAGPNSIAVDAKNNIAYVALYNANAVAVVDLSDHAWNPVMGMIPVGYAPSSVVLDAADNALLVANDKGIGHHGLRTVATAADAIRSPKIRTQPNYGVTGLNTHQDLGTVSIVPVPNILGLVGDDACRSSRTTTGIWREHLLGRRRQPACQAARNPGKDRRSIEDQARLPDHP